MLRVSKLRLIEIQNEIKFSKRVYLENCRKNYSEYVQAALTIFPDIYEQINEIDSKYSDINEDKKEYEDIKNKKNPLKEIEFLKTRIDETYSPWTFERIAILYGKLKDFHSAFNICEKWFESEYWKIPNMSCGSLKILNRMEKLKNKIDKTVANTS